MDKIPHLLGHISSREAISVALIVSELQSKNQITVLPEVHLVPLLGMIQKIWKYHQIRREILRWFDALRVHLGRKWSEKIDFSFCTEIVVKVRMRGENKKRVFAQWNFLSFGTFCNQIIWKQSEL